MKLVLFATEAAPAPAPGLLSEAGVVDVSALVRLGQTPQQTMQNIIDDFTDLHASLEAARKSGSPLPLSAVRLCPPLPRPGKMLNCIGNYWENRAREPRPLNMFLKNPDAVIGPGDTIRLPAFDEPSSFMHEAELALVIKGPVKDVPAARWREAVFGYTAAVDVTARGEGRYTWKKMSWLGKSFDTFAPLGPCIVTADEIANPNDLHVRLWCGGELRHDYRTSDMEHPVPELVAFATKIMTLHTGDVISCGTNHEGLGFLQDGDRVTIDIEAIGAMSIDVVDPLKRAWARGVYMGDDSTNHEAVRQHDPGGASSLRS